MGTTQTTIVGAGLFFLVIFLSGFWLRRSGKPFNGVILTIHKLISLAAVAFLAIAVYRMNQSADLSALESTTVVVTGLLFLATIVSGGLLSTDRTPPAGVLVLHRIAPFLTVGATAATLGLIGA